MRDINIFTNRPIEYNECYTLLSKNLKDVVKNGDDEIMIGKKYSVYFEITDETLLTYEIPFEKDFIDQIKLPGDPYMTGFHYRRSIDAKKVIEALLPAYPEMIVNVDDRIKWIGSAKDYLNKEFDY